MSSLPQPELGVTTGAAANTPVDIDSSNPSMGDLQQHSSAVDTTEEPLSEKHHSRDVSPSGKKRTLAEPSVNVNTPIKKSKDSEPSPVTPRFPSPTNEPATALDKETWQGYCEIESDPAYFSVILREIGIQGVTVREVPMMDPDLLATYPPVRGLVLLFRHREFDVAKQETTCPSHVWFANQMPGQNSCATLAMIHTLLNMDDPDIDVGEHMRQFKDFTKDMNPLQRGETFASWNYVKKIHNSFAKKMDMLENDKYLASKVAQAERAKARGLKSEQKKGARRDSDESIESNNSVENFEENAHHYIAFVPIKGVVWKLDGMDPQPTRMGSYEEEKGEDWLDAVSDRINALLASGDDDYGVFAIAQSPLIPLRKEFCEANNTIKRVDGRLSALRTDWKSFVDEDDREPPSPSWLGVFSEQQRPANPVPANIQAIIDEEDVVELLDRRRALLAEMRRLVQEYQSVEETEMEENEKADARRHDYGPAIQMWLGMLAKNGFLERYMQEEN